METLKHERELADKFYKEQQVEDKRRNDQVRETEVGLFYRSLLQQLEDERRNDQVTPLV